MKRFLECCAGIDIGKREVTVSVLIGPPNEEPKEDTRTFDTTVPALTECRDGLLGLACATAVVESTGSYWIPVWNVVREGIAVIVANPEHVKARRARRPTRKIAADWPNGCGWATYEAVLYPANRSYSCGS